MNTMRSEKVSSKKASNILIVDDAIANLTLLSEILKSEGYKVKPVSNGLTALQIVEVEKPDLILLDIMMPNMDGFEVCLRIKKNPKLRDIPIIFISALNDTRNIVKALNSGGVDYITKPFLEKEILVRVATNLRIWQQKQIILKQNIKLQKFKEVVSSLKKT